MPGYIEVQDSNMFDSKFESSQNVLTCVDSFDVVLSTKEDSRDGNSSEYFTPRGIEESRNGKITFLRDRGI